MIPLVVKNGNGLRNSAASLIGQASYSPNGSPHLGPESPVGARR